VAEFQEQAPELLQADLVRLEDDVWLDVLFWSTPVDEQRISVAAAAAPKSVEMHGLISDVLGHDRGDIVHKHGKRMADGPLEELANRAAAGDSAALSRLVDEV
jgi:hypothetical protein